MVKYTAGFEKIAADFRQRGIPTDKPGFCDHPKFLEAESHDPDYLNNYAAFVATQPYSTDYLHHARGIIDKASRMLHKELETNGRVGACIDMSCILSRILEEEGIWNCGIKGSLTITFPPDSNEEKTYFWSIDQEEFVAAHAWLFAPPFSIVDLAIRQQPYKGKKIDYLPDFVISESTSIVRVETDDIINPSFKERLSVVEVTGDRDLGAFLPHLKEFMRLFPALNVNGVSGAILKYCPVAIHATDTPFEEMRNMDFGGKTPFELYNESFKGRL
jgi:hypothetical protein